MEKIIEIAKTAGKIVKSAHCENGDINVKPGDANFVTCYDVKVQEFLKEKLTALFPDAIFIGEESNEDGFKKGNMHIVVDPIDGTTNFIKNTNHSAVCIAVMKSGMPYIGVVHNPFTDETFYAKAGCGAYMNGKRIRVSEGGLDNALVGFGTSPYYAELHKKTIDLALKMLDRCADIRRLGSAALDLCYVASGRFELFFEYKLSLWDYCAAGLIVKEAGGILKGENGADISFDGPTPIIAATPKAYDEFTKSFTF